MTDPQDDVPCRDCKRPTQHATEICDDCRTPAGRLVTALRERGIKSEASDDTDGVIVNGLFVDAVDCGWGISGNGDDLDDNIEAAANAIAAIVQAPGLRAERDILAAEVKRLREELEKPRAGRWRAFGFNWIRGVEAEVNAEGWMIWNDAGVRVAFGPETSDAGRHAADLALLDAGYRLVGGVHPAPATAHPFESPSRRNLTLSYDPPDIDGPPDDDGEEAKEVPDAR